MPGHQWRLLDLRVRDECADAQPPVLEADALERRKRTDVDHDARLGEPHVQRRKEGLATGQKARIIPILLEEFEDLVKILGGHEVEEGRFHGGILAHEK